MIDSILSEMQARCDAATPGPWPVESEALADHIGIWLNGSRWGKIVDEIHIGNSEAIAHARTDLPRCIKALRILERRIEDIERACPGHCAELRLEVLAALRGEA